jgi:lysozyme
LPYEKGYRPELVQRTEDPTIEPGPGANCQNGKIVELPESSRIHPKFSPRQVSIREYKGSTGIDVSHWNGTIDWGTVGSGDSPEVTFAIMKATEGTSYKKEYRDLFARWFKESKDKVKRTAYHFFRPDEDGYSQANYFMNTIYDAGGGDFGEFQVALDVEMTDYLNLDCGLQLSTDNIKAFLDQVEKMLGYKAMIYTSNSQWQALTTQPSWSGDYPLWVAAWNSGVAPGTLPKGWKDWMIWQYSDAGSVPGISSAKVDMNRWRE